MSELLRFERYTRTLQLVFLNSKHIGSVVKLGPRWFATDPRGTGWPTAFPTRAAAAERLVVAAETRAELLGLAVAEEERAA